MTWASGFVAAVCVLQFGAAVCYTYNKQYGLAGFWFGVMFANVCITPWRG